MARTSSLAAALLVASLFAIGASDAAAAGHVYVPNYNHNGPGSVSIYDITANGSLKVHSPASVAVGTGTDGISVSPDGHSVYVAASDGNIYQYNRAANGSLTQKSPFSVSPT